jgi:hypothetical protein
VAAWVQLYKASGGGWDGTLAVADATTPAGAAAEPDSNSRQP